MYKNHNIKIYVSTFGEKIINLKNGNPVEVGAARRDKFYYGQKDNTGNNISEENEFYGELTGLYWIWKNIKFDKDDLIGFCHYNKALKITNKQILRFFNKEKGTKWVALKESYIQGHPNQNEIDVILSILKKNYSEYYDTWMKIYDKNASGKKCRAANMFLTSYCEFDKYCKFLFSVLFEMRKQLGNNYRDCDVGMRRYCAYMGERLLAVYLLTNRCRVLGTDVRYKSWWLRPVRKIVKVLKIDKEKKWYKKLRNRYGYKSSYKN